MAAPLRSALLPFTQPDDEFREEPVIPERPPTLMGAGRVME